MERKHHLIFLIFLSLLTFACGGSPTNNAVSTSAVENQNSVKTVLTKTTVDEISEAFVSDKTRFAELCTGKTLVVTGAFVSIDDNKQESLAIVKSAATGATVKVIFGNFKTDRFYQLEEGQKVVVQGKCETAADGFVIKGTNILLAREDVTESNADQKSESGNQKVENLNQQSLKK